MLIFVSENDRIEYEKYAHPKLREEAEKFADFCDTHGLPKPIVTCAGRSRKENAATPGSVENSGHLLDPDLGDESFEALDFRVRHYNSAELKEVTTYWTIREEVTGGKVYYVHNLNHGTAPHLHVGIRT